MEVLTTETLASAINYSPEYSHMGDDESSYLAEHILNFFGFSEKFFLKLKTFYNDIINKDLL